MSGPKNCARSAQPASSSVTPTPVASPSAAGRTALATSLGRDAASTATSRTAVRQASNSISSPMKICATTRTPSQIPPRTGREERRHSRSTASTINGGSTANWSW